MKISNKMITAIAAIIVGVMFIAMKGEVISFAFTILGVAMIVMGTGANNLILRMLTQSAGENLFSSIGKDENIMAETKHVLIASVVNRGFSGDVMEAARAAGASGGTVIHSRRIGNEEVTGFWGLSVQEEKEIVLILSEVGNKINIMRSINENCGMNSEAKGIVVSLPIDSVITDHRLAGKGAYYCRCIRL